MLSHTAEENHVLRIALFATSIVVGSFASHFHRLCFVTSCWRGRGVDYLQCRWPRVKSTTGPEPLCLKQAVWVRIRRNAQVSGEADFSRGVHGALAVGSLHRGSRSVAGSAGGGQWSSRVNLRIPDTSFRARDGSFLQNRCFAKVQWMPLTRAGRDDGRLLRLAFSGDCRNSGIAWIMSGQLPQ